MCEQIAVEGFVAHFSLVEEGGGAKANVVQTNPKGGKIPVLRNPRLIEAATKIVKTSTGNGKRSSSSARGCLRKGRCLHKVPQDRKAYCMPARGYPAQVAAAVFGGSKPVQGLAARGVTPAGVAFVQCFACGVRQTILIIIIMNSHHHHQHHHHHHHHASCSSG